ncbi:MAG: hypothetical protein AABY22_04855 [Nanoarchaeota archaeon]
MKIIQIEAYEFDELDNETREEVVDRYRNVAFDPYGNTEYLLMMNDEQRQEYKEKMTTDEEVIKKIKYLKWFFSKDGFFLNIRLGKVIE